MGWYLYGVTGQQARKEAAGLRGIEDAEVTYLGKGGLLAAISRLRRPVEELQQAEARDTLEAARRHDQVLCAIARVAPVLPVRFGTVLADPEAAGEFLLARRDLLRQALEAVAEAEEWLIQVEASEAEPALEEASTAELTPGHAYFARRRARRDAEGRARKAACRTAASLAQSLAPLARDSRALPARAPATIARAAYLVSRRERENFLAAAARGGEGVSVQGPLPPYRFVGEELL